MTGASTNSNSDLVFVSPKATTSAAAAVPPVAAAPVSNSGDGLGIHEPRSMTWGGDIVATAPSGRADESAKCPAVTGSLSQRQREPACDEQADTCGSDCEVSLGDIDPVGTHGTPINSAPPDCADELIKTFGIAGVPTAARSSEFFVSIKNAIAFFVAAASEIISMSVSTTSIPTT